MSQIVVGKNLEKHIKLLNLGEMQFLQHPNDIRKSFTLRRFDISLAFKKSLVDKREVSRFPLESFF